MHIDKPIIWLIDENERELRTHLNVFKRLMGDKVEVKAEEAYRALQDYLPVVSNPRTACVITDQKLKVRGTADYTGIELAEYLREINPKLPIYILTNFADDKDEFEGGEWSVEDIIKKSDLGNSDAKDILKARILRRINVFDDIRTKREERLHILLQKDLAGELEHVEFEELKELQLQKMSPSLVMELAQIQQMEQIAKAHEELMKRLENLVQKDDENVI